MWVLCLGLGFHLRVSKPFNGYFEVWVLYLKLIFHLNLQYSDLYLLLPTGILGLCCNTYTCTYLYQLEFWGFVAIPTPIFTFTNWNFRASLQYMYPYLPLPIGILVFNYNTCTCTYFYQLGFWGRVTIPTFNTNIITILMFLHFTFFVVITWKQ